jgi:hypothetical protein
MKISENQSKMLVAMYVIFVMSTALITRWLVELQQSGH